MNGIGLPQGDIGDGRWADSVVSPNRGSAISAVESLADYSELGVIEPSQAMASSVDSLISGGRCFPAFGVATSPVLVAGRHSTSVPSVAGVLDRSTEFQMIRSDAGRVIALVENPHSIGDRPVVELPGQSTSNDMAVVPSALPELSVAFMVDVGRPYPTLPQVGAEGRAVLVDLGPKARLDRSFAPIASSLVGASLNHASKYTKWGATA